MYRTGRVTRGPWLRWGVAVLGTAITTSALGADLMSVYRAAQACDPTFDAARQTLAASREKLPQARAAYFPSVELNGNKNHTDAVVQFPYVNPTHRGVSAWTWNVQLSQAVVRPQFEMALHEAGAQVQAAEAEFALAEQDLLVRVAQAYFGVLTAEEDIAAAQAQVRAMEEQWVVAKQGFKLGTASITDADEAKSKADLARSQLVEAQSNLETARAELERIVGNDVGGLAKLRDTTVQPRPDPADPRAWIQRARDDHPAVRASVANEQAAGFSVQKAHAEHMPTFDLTASYGNNFSSGSLSTSTDYYVRGRSTVTGFQLSIPIMSGGLASSHVREAIDNEAKARAQTEEARRKAAADARQAYSGVTNGLSKIEALESAVASSESSVKGNKVGYKLGLRINSDVLSAEQQLYTSRRDLAKARYDTLFQGLKLKAAAGVLSEADLQVIDGMFER
jgi:outer membrane protein